MGRPTAQDLQALLTDLSWAPPGTSTVRRPDVDYACNDADIPDLNEVTRVASEAPALVAEVASAHAGRHSRWKVPRHEVGATMHAALVGAGYHAYDCMALMHDLSGIGSAEAEDPEVRSVEVLREWYTVRVASGRADAVPPEQHLAAELAIGPRFRHFLLRRGGTPTSAGGVITWPDAGAALLWGGATAPDQRVQGEYRALIRARLQWLVARGFRAAWSVAGNPPSVRALRDMGFVGVGAYLVAERNC